MKKDVVFSKKRKKDGFTFWSDYNKKKVGEN